MKSFSIFTAIFLLMCTGLFAQNLKPQKDKTTKKYGFVDNSDAWVVQPIYDDADKMKDGFAKIYLAKKEGLIDEKGNVIVIPQYNEIEKFKDNVAQVELNKLVGLIDKTGKEILNPQFEKIWDFSGDYAKVLLKNKLGLIKIDGTILIVPGYKELEILGSTVLVLNYSTWGMLKIDGTVLFEPDFIEKPVFNIRPKMKEDGNLAIVKKLIGGKITFGLISIEGDTKLDFKYTDMLHTHTEVAISAFAVKTLEGAWCFMDNTNKKISDDYEELLISNRAQPFLEGLCAVKKGGKYGFVDAGGKIRIPLNFDGVDKYGFQNRYCGVKVSDKWGFIDDKGTYPKNHTPIFDEILFYVTRIDGDIDLKSMVMMGGKKYAFYPNDGRLVEIVNTANTVTTDVTTTPTTTPTTNTTPTIVATDASWLIGSWKVVEEKIGIYVVGGKDTKFVNYSFLSGGSGSYVERYDIMANKTNSNYMAWTFQGGVLNMKSVDYQVIVAPDKKTMTIFGPLGSYWKVAKQ